MSRIIELYNKVKGKDIVDKDSYLMGLSDMLKSLSDIVKSIDDLNLTDKDLSLLSECINMIKNTEDIDINKKYSFIELLSKIMNRKKYLNAHKKTIKRLKG